MKHCEGAGCWRKVNSLFPRVKINGEYRHLCVNCTVFETKWLMVDTKTEDGTWCVHTFGYDQKDPKATTVVYEGRFDEEIWHMNPKVIAFLQSPNAVFLEFVRRGKWQTKGMTLSAMRQSGITTLRELEQPLTLETIRSAARSIADAIQPAVVAYYKPASVSSSSSSAKQH